MAIKIYDEIYSLEEHKPWCGAIYAHKRICEAGLAEQFVDYIGELFPDGLTSTELNDVLWFEDELIEDFLEAYDETYYDKMEDETK